ncbi:hypothetical protein IFM89_010087 [Coptis chinensis]|uniref:T-complex protein 1 subunit eta n=1 Tax=Coptis chinensis TaxID=261450 RepID=A0A835LXG4_9MAGN|nr:hypothetical protein IFM89_010087 [Coptis chinensis]
MSFKKALLSPDLVEFDANGKAFGVTSEGETAKCKKVVCDPSYLPDKQPQIILLKEGTDTSQGKPQIISNINACTGIANVVRTTLGPRGMDKLIHDDKGNATISNDGATIMKLLDVVHPAAKILVDIAKSQDSEVGDGTTRVVLFAGEFLKEAKPFIEDGVHSKSYNVVFEMPNLVRNLDLLV